MSLLTDRSRAPPKPMHCSKEQHLARKRRQKALETAASAPAPFNVNNWLVIKPSPLGGLGVFARKNLKPGMICLEEPAIVAYTSPKDKIATEETVAEVEEYLNGSKNESKLFWMLTDSGADSEKEETTAGTLTTNGITYKDGYSGVWATISRINHGCPVAPLPPKGDAAAEADKKEEVTYVGRPNCALDPKGDQDVTFRLVALKHIKPGEELLSHIKPGEELLRNYLAGEGYI
ncbi:hypothetical protein KIPB_010691 [Kipferlia bialata]|uniref:SET domain-containing protein n=1 Tax=Kipferlia bialata TaxID=797122 RepID=A0A9K3D3E7_9EUKA|nr:hypothetical protein KIPB_010691 [Kipferlia bialata]|eukprot:g10691.t1